MLGCGLASTRTTTSGGLETLVIHIYPRRERGQGRGDDDDDDYASILFRSSWLPLCAVLVNYAPFFVLRCCAFIGWPVPCLPGYDDLLLLGSE